jgi:guanylate kinase
LQKRLDAAIAEIQYAVEGGHDIVVVNDDVERAYGVLEKVALGAQVEGDKLPEFGL